MEIVAIGLAGFALLAVWEWVFLTRARVLKPVLLAGSFTLLAAATWMACTDPVKVDLPSWTVVPGAILAGLFSFLMFYSIFLDIPFAPTYGTAQGGRRLITTGTYALSRHPGVFWYPFVGVGLFLAFGSTIILLAWPIWSLANAACVLLEEKVQLERDFGVAYREYQRTTPMVVPTLSSTRRFILQFKALGHSALPGPKKQ